MIDPAALRQVRPFVAIPSYGGQVATTCAGGLMGLANLAWRHGFAMQTRFLDGDSLVTRARSRLLAEFLADTRWTHLFFIDADIGFEPEAALRLLAAGRDVVAGIYPLKAEPWPEAGLSAPLPAGTTRAQLEALQARFPVNALADGATVDEDGFVEALDAPTGFMLIARGVFERMAQALPGLRYTPDTGHAGTLGTGAAHHWRFFDTLAEPDNGRWLSEDYAFCRRWQSLGGRVHIDTRSRFTHQGLRVWRGDFAQAFEARQARQARP